MSTTHLELPDEVRALADMAAKRKGMTTQAFMVDAIRVAATAIEIQESALEEASDSRDEMLATGKGYVAEEVHEYLRKRVHGDAVKRPEAKQWRD